MRSAPMGMSIATKTGTVAAMAAVLCLCAGSASAHEPPRGHRLAIDGDLIVMVTGRGLVLSQDGGAHFDLYCNEAAGLASNDLPPLHLRADGRVLMSTFLGVQTSSADFCDYAVTDSLATGAPALAVDPSDDAHLLAGTNIPEEGDAVPVYRLFASEDDGDRFELVSELPTNTFFRKGLVIAPSDPMRLYGTATGPVGDAGAYGDFLVVSSTAGVDLELKPLQLNDEQYGPVVRAVHPQDADVVWLSISGRPEQGQLDTLMRSRDGGDTFESVLELETLYDAVLSPSGDRLWVAGRRGLWLSRDGGESFERLIERRVVSCLAYAQDRLWACLDGDGPGVWAGLAYSQDDGESFEQVMHFDDVQEPPPCPVGSDVWLQCDRAWEDWYRELLAPADAGMVLIDAGTAPDAGPSRDAGRDASVAPQPDADVDAGDTSGGGSGGGCGCRTLPTRPGSRPGGPAALLLLLALGVVAARRRF